MLQQIDTWIRRTLPSTQAKIVLQLKDNVAVNEKLNEGLAARYICLENIKLHDTKKLKEYNDSMFHELLKTENKMKKVEAENKKLRWDLKKCKGTLASLGNRYAPVEAAVERMLQDVTD